MVGVALPREAHVQGGTAALRHVVWRLMSSSVCIGKSTSGWRAGGLLAFMVSAGNADSDRLADGERKAIHMKTHNWAFIVLGCLGLLLQGIGSALAGVGRKDEEVALSVLIIVLGGLAMGIGASFLAAGKGRSLWFGLLGVISPLGLLFLCVLEDRSLKQGAAASAG